MMSQCHSFSSTGYWSFWPFVMVMVMVIIVKVCLIINYPVPVTCHGPAYPDGYRGTDKTDRPFAHNAALIISISNSNLHLKKLTAKLDWLHTLKSETRILVLFVAGP